MELFGSQTSLDLAPLGLSRHSDLIARSIESNMHLVERILLALLKLLLASLDTLIATQTGVLLLDLGHPTSLESRIRRLEPSLGVSVDLGGILVGQRQCVQRIINTRCAEIACSATRG